MYNPSGVFGLMLKAASGARDEGYRFYMNGDLNGMGIQAEFLRLQGFDVGYNDVYPGLRTEEEFKRALQLFWDREVEGWWNYREKMISYDICTTETWQTKIDAYCANRKAREEAQSLNRARTRPD